MKLSACGTSCSKGRVFQRVQTTIHWITQLILIALVRRIVIYPVDSALYRLKNKQRTSWRRWVVKSSYNWENSTISKRKRWKSPESYNYKDRRVINQLLKKSMTLSGESMHAKLPWRNSSFSAEIIYVSMAN